ncbi:T9SS type A sorting domain-containing protein [Polaribacter sp.]|uniref:T9SS type A sorting domain-containing protein n=1 Tax=Polaribacter sp. TaxID=1920175 RepID=UPI003F6C413C
MKKITLLFITLLTVVSIQAQTVQIGATTYSSITEAIDAASDGDIIDITGVHTEAITFGKSITLRGTNPTTDIIQEAATPETSGAGTGVINVIRAEDADVLTVTIENLGIRNGNSAENGGGINVDKVTGLLSLNNLIIENNYSDKNGGGLSLAGSNVDITSCTIKDNNSRLDGGGLLAAPNNGVTVDSNVKIEQSLLDNNIGRNGGAMYLNGNPQFGDNNKMFVTIENTTVSNNQATSPSGGNGGGSIWSRSATFQGTGGGANVSLQLVHATFFKNSHAGAPKNGIRFGGSSNTLFSAYNSIIVNDDVIANRAINFLGADVTDITNCILGGLENAASALSIIDDTAKNNLKGRTSVQAGLTGTLADEGGSTQVITLTEGSNGVNFCTATVNGITLPNVDQRGATRTGTPDAGAFELGGTLSTTNFELANTVSIYPNPAKHKVTINGVDNIASIKVFNILGKLVKKVNKQNTISVAELPKGMYLLTILKENNVVSKRLLVE